MQHPEGSGKCSGESHLRLAASDGEPVPDMQSSPDQNPNRASKIRAFFEKLLLDFAFGSELFYPNPLYEHLRLSEEKEKERDKHEER